MCSKVNIRCLLMLGPARMKPKHRRTMHHTEIDHHRCVRVIADFVFLTIVIVHREDWIGCLNVPNGFPCSAFATVRS